MAYCTREDIEKKLSAAGVDLRTDDDDSGGVDDAIEHADSEIQWYCGQRYSTAQLERTDSTWIKQQATVLSAYYLCCRRGDPVPIGIAQQYEQSMGYLKSILSGGGQIPGLAQSKGMVPVMSNIRVIQTPLPHVVVEKTTSTGRPSGYRQVRDPYDQVNNEGGGL